MEMWSRQSGSIDSPDGKRREAKFTRAFTVELLATDRIEEALRSSGLPRNNEPYPGTRFVICRSRKPQRLAPTLAMVTVEYSGEIGLEDIGGTPDAQEILINWRSVITDELIDQDVNQLPIVTVNNEPIDGITERIPDQICTIQRNFLAIDVYAISAYLRSRNSDSFLGWPPGTARFMDYSAENIISDGVAGFWKVSATFQFRIPYNTTPAKAWWKRVRHEGFLVRATPADEPGKAFDPTTKTFATKPVLLKANGTLETDPANAHWLEFETTKALPYNALGLLP
jgi:hypothetical protein